MAQFYLVRPHYSGMGDTAEGHVRGIVYPCNTPDEVIVDEQTEVFVLADTEDYALAAAQAWADGSADTGLQEVPLTCPACHGAHVALDGRIGYRNGNWGLRPWVIMEAVFASRPAWDAVEILAGNGEAGVAAYNGVLCSYAPAGDVDYNPDTPYNREVMVQEFEEARATAE